MELLAPAGDENALIAAVQNGADAVYLGTGAFNARRNAANFDGDALDRAVAYCHARGVKVHVTLNTLVTPDELHALNGAIDAVYRSGADAVIVQDFGVVRAVRQRAPQLQLHASTQMAVHNRQGVAFLAKHGFDRAVLARELTFEEMAECAAQGIEIETFVHGALCVACSGQCLMSSLVGGRSGNRGLCAQPCRLPWRLDGRDGHLLSTRDLCALYDLGKLRAAGVSSLKIEGRMKRAEYVAVTVAAYRRALDALYEGRATDMEGERAELLQMFNRGGFTRGYGPGVSEGDLMYPERPNHIGVAVGHCRKRGSVALEMDVESADALVLRRAGSEDIPVKLAGMAGEDVKCTAARYGDALFRLVSAAQMRAARESCAGEHRQTPTTLRATLHVGQPARLWASDGTCEAEVVGEVVQRATGRGFDADRASAQLKKTGGTAYAVNELYLDADVDAFCPASMLNALRRDALAALEKARTAVGRTAAGETGFETPPPSLSAGTREALGETTPCPWALPGEKLTAKTRPLPPLKKEAPASAGGGVLHRHPLLLAQSSDVNQLALALAGGADLAVYAPTDVRLEALEAVDLSPLGDRVALALPAVLTAEALDELNAWAQGRPFVMTFLSNIGQFALDWPGKKVGDYLLNVGNDLAVDQLGDWGLRDYTPSVELTAAQAGALNGQKHLVIWGRIPLMHLRHCPLRAAEGMRGKHAACRFCDGCKPSQRLDGREMVDRKGAAFPLRRLAMPGGCVIQVLNSVPLMPLKKLNKLPKAESWRLLLNPGEPTADLVKVYRAALDGEDFRALPLWKAMDTMKTTAGHYFRGVE